MTESKYRDSCPRLVSYSSSSFRSSLYVSGFSLSYRRTILSKVSRNFFLLSRSTLSFSKGCCTGLNSDTHTNQAHDCLNELETKHSHFVEITDLDLKFKFFFSPFTGFLTYKHKCVANFNPPCVFPYGDWDSFRCSLTDESLIYGNRDSTNHFFRVLRLCLH